MSNIRQVIESCVAEGVYPSVREVSTRLGGKGTLPKSQLTERRKIMIELRVPQVTAAETARKTRLAGRTSFNKYPIKGTYDEPQAGRMSG